jgi:hypothetical protein
MAEIMEKEKRQQAAHLRAYYGKKGITLGRPILDDRETAAEAINGIYRIKSTPSMGGSSNGVVNGHIALPRSKFTRTMTPVSWSARSESDATSLPGVAPSVRSSRAPSAPTVGRLATPVGTPARSQVSVLSQAREASALEEQARAQAEAAWAANSGPPRPGSAASGSQFTSISQRRSHVTQSSLKNEVEALVMEQMERVVQPLQRRLGEEVAKREGLEQKVKELMTH